MSDQCIHELEDIYWNQFVGNDDRIVPCTSYDSEIQLISQADKKKKGSNFFIPMSQEVSMLEKKPLPHTGKGAFSDSYDVSSVEIMEGVVLEDPKVSSHGYVGPLGLVDSDFCSDDPLLQHNSTAGDNSLYNYSLDGISQTGKNLSIFGNRRDVKENGDLFYDWPDIENFEDVDKMFRSCDSTFGMESLYSDDLGLFSPSEVAEGTETLLASEAKQMKLSEVQGCSMPESTGPLSGSISGKNLIANDSSGDDIAGASGCSITTKLSDAKSQVEDGLVSPRKHGRDATTFSLACMRNSEPFTELIYDHSDQFSVCENMSGIKSEHYLLQSLSNGSSYASNQAQSVEGFYGSAADGAKTLDKMGKLQQNEAFLGQAASNFNHKLFSAQKQIYPTEKDREGQAELKGAVTNVQEQLGSARIPENSCTSSVLDEISLEATSFRQLRHVVDQLDIRTKRCIRDSLYRLAKSAEQRHHFPNGGTRDERDTDLTAEDATSKYAGFLDMETDTNPIDRSIAHLLFHRPSDSSLMSSSGVLSSKSQNMIAAAADSHHLMVEKQGETAVPSIDKNV